MTKKTKMMSALVPLVLIASCSNLESFDAKMSRYKSRDTETNKVPALYPVDYKIMTRSIASAEQVSPEKKEKPNKDEFSNEYDKNLTNKKLYFQSLYEQYADLSMYIPEKQNPKLDSCPQFHGNFLEYKKSGNRSYENNFVFSYEKSKFAERDYLAKHPELLLPIAEDDSLPRAVDILMKKPDMAKSEQNEIVKNALALHLKKTYTELRELCEYGVSQNYYIFENLMTHAKSTGISANTDGVTVLLKTTLFSNLALKTSLDSYKEASPTTGRIPASEESKEFKEAEIMKRLNVVWMKDYYQKMHKLPHLSGATNKE